MTTKNNLMSAAAFVMEGLHDAGYQACVDAYPRPVLDLVDEVTSYVPYIERLAEAAYAYLDSENIGRPGVFPYEVTSPFGKWWGLYLIENREAPFESVVYTYLTQSVFEFCVPARHSGLNNDQQLRLSEILIAVPKSTTPTKLGQLPTNKTREILTPPGGWKEHTYYVVDVAHNSANPIHRVILHFGYFGSKNNPLGGGYTCLLSGSYEGHHTNLSKLWYLRPVSIIEDLHAAN